MATKIGGLSSRERIDNAVVQLYLAQGLEATTNRALAQAASVGAGSLNNVYSSKEDMLLVCFEHISKRQKEFFTEIQKKSSKEHTYCLEIAVELYMCDCNPVMKEVYSEAYSLPKTMEFIKNTFYKKSEWAFKEHLSKWTEHDFYEAEITKTGIMFGYIMESSNPYFTQEHKIKRCLTSVLKLYEYDESERKNIIEKVAAENIVEYSEQLLRYIKKDVQ